MDFEEKRSLAFYALMSCLWLLEQIITNLVVEKSTNLLSYPFVGQKYALSQGAGASAGESISFPFPASGGQAHSLAHGLFLQLQIQHSSSSLSHIIPLTLVPSSHHLLTLTLLPVLFAFKGTCEYFGPTQIIQDKIPILRSFD